MSPPGEQGPQDLKAFLKLGVAFLGALGGVAAIFIAFGYIALQSFLSYEKLYGLVYFPLQFYKEAGVTFWRDILGYFHGHVYWLPIPIIVFMIPIGASKYLKADGPRWRFDRKTTSRVFIGASLAIAFLTFNLEFLRRPSLIAFFFYALSVPSIGALFLHLALDFQRLDLRHPLKTSYIHYLLVFIVLWLSIPVGYGNHFYDISVFTVSVPECSSENTVFRTADRGGYRLLYLMGHTSEREIFFDATKPPVKILLVDKKLINSIRVDYSQVQVLTLRKLFSVGKSDALEKPGFLGRLLEAPSVQRKIERNEMEAWIETKPSDTGEPRK